MEIRSTKSTVLIHVTSIYGVSAYSRFPLKGLKLFNGRRLNYRRCISGVSLA